MEEHLQDINLSGQDNTELKKQAYVPKWLKIVGFFFLLGLAISILPLIIGGLSMYLINENVSDKKTKYALLSAILLLTVSGSYAWFSNFSSTEPKSSQNTAAQTSVSQVLTPSPRTDFADVLGQNQVVASPSPFIASGVPIESPNVNTEQVKVIKVIDGDTIQIEGGKKVRYIGIDTPETLNPGQPEECYGKEATLKNKELVGGQYVTLEKDVSEKDKYGRLLRYVWIGSILVSEYLVREGYANVSTYPPDVKYQDRFMEAERQAREEEKGLWGTICDIWAPPITSAGPIATPTVTTIQPITPRTNTGDDYSCNCAKICDQMASCDEAYYQLRTCGCSKRDGDSDGVPCEKICPGG